MKIEKGQIVTFSNDEKFLIVETISEGSQVWHYLRKEDDDTVNIFCVEVKHEDGTYDYIQVTDDAEIKVLAEKFEAILNS